MSQLMAHYLTYYVPEDAIPTLRTCDDVAIALRSAALSPDSTACTAVIARAQAAGFADADLTDICIVQAARRLGENWCDDVLGFVDVSIATARLQGLLRTLGRSLRADAAGHGNAATLLVVSAAQAQHTLGPSLVVAQLRRRGYSVGLLLDAGPGAVRTYLRRAPADAVFVSCDHTEKLVKLRPIVTEARKTQPGVRIVVGGPGISECSAVCRITGADHATSDLEEALILCGLTKTASQATTAEMMM
ncbi:MAG: cobalamin B12-binding domain-containing protein [Alphaproteobacteria bacterium]|nr:cobalamin B12-binding domain-containing protein [Alphaproteobacteria bacterium]